jgi:carbamoyl-phosphate synthase small subunit
MRAALMLKDGTTLYGRGFGAEAIKEGELVFNTSMTGYQEALTDPSYAGQILLMSYPLIGNYGINEKDFESGKVQVEGFAVREISDDYSHRSAVSNVDSFLKENNVSGISGIDTRFLVRKIRNVGVMPAVLATYNEKINVDRLAEKLDFDYSGINFVERVSTKEMKWFGNGKNRVVLVDYGVKKGIVDSLVSKGVEVAVVPCFFSAEQIKELEPDGIVLSNGPGDPAILTDAHRTIKTLSEFPIFGICLGHQLLAHAFGGSTFKLKFGHRGSNHPVYDELKKRIAITTQNHGFAVDEKKIPADFEITHRNANDKTVEGMRHVSKPIFSVQFHPEARPGPHDSGYLFDEFVGNLE